MRLFLLLLAGVACSPRTADDPSPPPLPMSLVMTAPPARGDVATFEVTGAPDDAPLLVVVAEDGPGQACPAAIAPDCLDVAAPFFVVAQRRTGTPAGTEVFDVPIPASLSPERLSFQAVSRARRQSYLSQAVTVDVGTTLVALRDGSSGLQPGDDVTVYGLVVTALEATGFWAQQPGAARFGGTYVFTNSLPFALAPGDVVNIDGVYEEFDNNGSSTAREDTLSELIATSSTGGFTMVGTTAVPAPVEVSVAELGDPARREELEGMRVRLADTGPLAVSQTTSGNFGEFYVEAAPGAREQNIDNAFVDLDSAFPALAVGDQIDSVTGLLVFNFDEHKVAPRTASEVVGYRP